MSALLGAPRTIAERDINSRLPNFGGSVQKSHALGVHVKLANIEGLIQQSKLEREYSYRSLTNSFTKPCTVKKAALAVNS